MKDSQPHGRAQSVRLAVALAVLVVLAACAGSGRGGVPSDDQQGPNQSGSAARGQSDTDLEVEAVSLPDLGAAPELANELWFNTPAPLRLQDLRGKVVLLDMWTFG